jgi:hypothetical protein
MISYTLLYSVSWDKWLVSRTRLTVADTTVDNTEACKFTSTTRVPTRTGASGGRWAATGDKTSSFSRETDYAECSIALLLALLFYNSISNKKQPRRPTCARACLYYTTQQAYRLGGWQAAADWPPPSPGKNWSPQWVFFI